MTQTDLESRVRQFAREVTGVLNTTITSGTRLSSVVEQTAKGPRGLVGWKITKLQLYPESPFKAGKGYLDVRFRLDLDQDGHLRMLKSRIAYYAEGDFEAEPLFRYEYERNKEVYPEAHLHVHGDSLALDKISAPSDKMGVLKRLHFPVGGRRYRPILEDVIEMIIVHGWAAGHEGYEIAIEEGRQRYFRTQLGASIRSDPEGAREALEGLEK